MEEGCQIGEPLRLIVYRITTGLGCLTLPGLFILREYRRLNGDPGYPPLKFSDWCLGLPILLMYTAFGIMLLCNIRFGRKNERNNAEE